MSILYKNRTGLDNAVLTKLYDAVVARLSPLIKATGDDTPTDLGPIFDEATRLPLSISHLADMQPDGRFELVADFLPHSTPALAIYIGQSEYEGGRDEGVKQMVSIEIYLSTVSYAALIALEQDDDQTLSTNDPGLDTSVELVVDQLWNHSLNLGTVNQEGDTLNVQMTVDRRQDFGLIGTTLWTTLMCTAEMDYTRCDGNFFVPLDGVDVKHFVPSDETSHIAEQKEEF